MRRGAAVALALFLAACAKPSGTSENQLSANEKSIAPTTNVAAASNASMPASSNAGNEPGALPPADSALRFVGVWAKSQPECTSHPWHFTADKLAVAGGPNCSLYKVSKVPGGYDLAAQCPDKKPEPTDLIKLRFAESARAMLVESNVISPMGLIYCGK